ncbi:MAG: hypothetical protein JRJ15_00415 [Deltaproteobacteria bacterium]|nr:hypothetical protein [Deltaproteobacteria bacterium]
MRRGLALLSMIFLLAAVPAAAADLLAGTVVSVERKNGKLILRQADMKKDIEVLIHPDLIPGFVESGVKVTAWGDYVQRDPDVFQARKITPEKSRKRGKDPTGVRSRLK